MKIINLESLLAVLLLTFFSCDSENKEFEKRAYKNLDKVQVGDDSMQVLKIMGRPKRIYSLLGDSDSSIMVYTYGKINDWDIDLSPISVYFDSVGKVSSKGTGEKSW